MTLLEFSDNLKRRSTYLRIYKYKDIDSIFYEPRDINDLLYEGTASMLSHSVFFQKNCKLHITAIWFDERTYMIMVGGDIK